MSFQTELESICREVPGSLAAVVMNLDGILVVRHEVQETDLDLEVMLIELTASLKQAIQALTSVEGGQLSEIMLKFEEGALHIRMLNDEHFVALLANPSAYAGQGRHSLRWHGASLNEELV